MKGLLAAHNVDGSLQKVFQPHVNLTEDDGRSPGCTESYPNIIEGLQAARKDHGKFQTTRRLSVNIPMQLGDLPSTSVKFMYSCEIFCLLL